MSLFKIEICFKYSPTIQNAIHRDKGFTDLEKENECVEHELSYTREKVMKVPEEDEE